MNDYIVRALAYDGQIRAFATCTTNLVSEAQKRHDTWPTASAALGRTMTAGTMMGTMLKGDDKLTITVEGGGPIGVIIVDANAKGETRGYVTNPHVHFDLNEHGKLDVARAVGHTGFLSVVKDLGMRENFTGRVPMVSGEIGDDFTYYFVRSEQVPSAVGVGVLVNPDDTIKASGGFILQVLPGADDQVITQIEERINSVPPISRLIDQGLTPEEILFKILGDDQVKILDKTPIVFKCHCSKEKIGNAIIGLGTDEIRNMIEEDQGAEASCQFCRETYHFNVDELEELYKESAQKFQ